MTAAQNAKYFAEWGKLRDVLRARGLTSAQCEEYRRDLTRRALGAPKSSKDFTNAEFDAVLARISAETRPTDLAAQLRLQDMPEKRLSMLLARVEYLARHIGLTEGNETHYVDGIALRMFGRQYHQLPERALAQIEGILRRRLHQQKLTTEQIHEIERGAAAAAEERVASLAGSYARIAQGSIVPDDDGPSF